MCRCSASIGVENRRRGPLFDHPPWQCSRVRRAPLEASLSIMVLRGVCVCAMVCMGL